MYPTIRAPARIVVSGPRRALDAMFGSTYKVVLSPCVGICALDPQGYCEGCLRSAGEIARWSQMSDDERLRYMTMVLPEREAQRA
jgi:uncharacterized protein